MRGSEVWCRGALALGFAIGLLVLRTNAQQIGLQSSTTAASGWHAQYEMHVAPDNPDNMILCGFRSDPKDNALYGFVYSSSDGGKTWRQAFEPKNSTFESEGSCAFGTRGVAYCVNSASKVIDGENHHEQGATRIYVSHDAGRTWKLATTTGWTDWCTSVVDTMPGANENRLYVFFNAPSLFLTSVGQKDNAELQLKRSNEVGGWIGMISFKDGDPQVAGPFSTTDAGKEKYLRGSSFPGPAIRLKDGSILTISSGKRRSEKNVREFFVEAVRTTPDRTGLERPVNVVSSLDSPSEESSVSCGGYYLDPAAAYDPVRDKVYFVYSGVADNACRLFLTASVDGGRSWSKATPIYSPDIILDRRYANPAIAVNKDGLLGLMWRENLRSGCWMFATSPDDGKSLSRAQPLGNCRKDELRPSALSTPYLWTSFFQADPKESADGARINLRNTRNTILGRNQDSITVTAEGTFHLVWIDEGEGEGTIRTAAIQVTPAASMISSATAGFEDLTDKVAVLYGGNQTYDVTTGILSLDVVVESKSDAPIRGPIKLAVPDLYKDFGFAEIANADNRAVGAGAIWDISSALSGDVLAPGATTKPFTLKFRYLADPGLARDSDDILGLSVKVYAKP